MVETGSIATRLAEFAVETSAKAVPALALERAKMSLASTIASAAMGFDIPSARIIRDLDRAAGGSPDATVWFDGTKVPPSAAARINATASDAAASDDSDLRS